VHETRTNFGLADGLELGEIKHHFHGRLRHHEFDFYPIDNPRFPYSTRAQNNNIETKLLEMRKHNSTLVGCGFEKSSLLVHFGQDKTRKHQDRTRHGMKRPDRPTTNEARRPNGEQAEEERPTEAAKRHQSNQRETNNITRARTTKRPRVRPKRPT
jgi:hypothetical protein